MEYNTLCCCGPTLAYGRHSWAVRCVWENRLVNTNGWNDFPPEGWLGSALKRGGQSRAAAAHCQAATASGIQSRCASWISPWRGISVMPNWRESTLALVHLCAAGGGRGWGGGLILTSTTTTKNATVVRRNLHWNIDGGEGDGFGPSLLYR